MNPFIELAEDLRGQDWRDHARCAEGTEFPDTWWPDKGHTCDEAVAICQRCPVKRECLQFALDNREHSGVWGGMTPTERKALKKVPERPANECVNGHDLDKVGVRNDGYCRQCDKDRWQRYRDRRRAGLVAPRADRPRLRVVDGGAA